jgi:hypothetical protein
MSIDIQNGLIMGVTVAANGLSIVHQGSGGEASATLPDVCLTTVGNAVAPIPYGNSAKSADLADGTTTITMDGGNSVAIKGSTFSASTGDSGGDKKGVASGSIEDEAKFISASPTVNFEGAGVCRLSDQMTMNKANTMCLGGAQNPSVSVTEDEEGTYTVDLFLSYSDGDPVQGATYKLIDQTGAVLEGTLDDSGKATVSDVAPGVFTVEYGEDTRDFTPDVPTKDNPKYNSTTDAQELIDIAKQGKVGFWENSWRKTSGTASWSWGVIFGEFFYIDATVEQIITNTAITKIPNVDQVDDLTRLATNIMRLLDEDARDEPEFWLMPTLDLMGCVPIFGSALKGTCEVALEYGKQTPKDDLLAYLRALGKGDPETFLTDLKWDDYAKDCAGILSDVFTSCCDVGEALSSLATSIGALELAQNYSDLVDEFKTVDKVATDKISDAMTSFESLFSAILGKDEDVFPARTYYSASKGNAQSGSKTDKVNEDVQGTEICELCEQVINRSNEIIEGTCKRHMVN